ncbi:hypothetical protein DKM44_02435 [Deinococcus irradiatisoli]|uniref:Carrier domain-containing protein n=1 Tax=Deinococcus irradiatisoli TaxID=2202254 RepID=A0A2Z3JLV7_9DEIO|nr:non-ribosomal peptide synthetase [Deinococcus irradiatisoli]AWN22234.1 hypothetical protein DKM44_02435 [Deinococcus irradiatisoli]
MKIIGISPLKANHPETEAATLSAFELELAKIWEAVLEQSEIGSQDHFFELGGNSLGVMRVSARVRATFGVDVPLAALFQNPTLAGMARQVEEALLGTSGLKLPPLLPAPAGSTQVLSAAQERMWLLHQMDRGGTAYNVTGVARLSGPLSVGHLEAGFRLLLERHPTLRTTFSQQADRLIAKLQPVEFSLPVVDLSAQPPERREALALEDIRMQVMQPFDLETGPVFRALLYRLSDHEHLVLLDLPHINSDAWSLGVLMRDLVASYEALQAGQSLQLPALTIQYSDFAQWQQSWLRGEVYEELRAYWVGRLKDFVPLDLPLDHMRPPTLTFKGATESVRLDQDLVRHLRRLAQQENATLFMVMLTAFKVLLQRWTGIDDLAVGTPMAGRQHQGLEQIIGVFVNTLVLRTDLAGEPTFRELIGRVRATAIEAFIHQDMPFAQLVAELQPPRILNRSPIVQVLFNQINVPMPALQMADIQVSPVELDRGGAQFELSCMVSELPGEERVAFEYNTALFDQVTMQRLLGQYQQLLWAMVQDADQSAVSISLLTSDDWRRIEDLNQTQSAFPQATLHALFEKQVKRTPEAAALRLGDQELSYQALNCGANRLARQLQRHGLVPGTPVALFLNRSFESVMSILAVLKAGGAYVPLDPSHPAARLTFILEDTEAPLVITTRKLQASLPFTTAQVIYADQLLEEPQEQGENLDLPLRPEQLAYIIYTSGSTGTPKGVLGLHQGMVNRLDWMWKTYPFTPGEVLCQKTALGFLDSMWEMFGPLLRGVPSVIVPDEAARNPEQLAELLESRSVTRIVLVPSLLSALLDFGPRLTDKLHRLRLWTVSGEPLSEGLISRFREVWPQARLLNLYGSTEVSADATAYEVSAGTAGSPALIGRPLQNVQAYVVDRWQQLVPPGTPGELMIGGVGVAAGYHGQAQLTAERFLSLPFVAGRVYRTGDRVTLTSAGQLRFLGRVDRQLKIRGVRVEPSEIEAALLAHPAVRACAVVAYGQDHQALAAYLMLSYPVENDELRLWMMGKVPSHFMPSVFVMLDALPLTPSGKLDWRALPEPSVAAPVSALSPETLLQQQLVELWQELLEHKPVGINDDFFALGGHSLLAIRFVVQLEQRLGIHLPLTAVFEAPTIAALARRIEQKDHQTSPMLPLQISGDSAPLFCFQAYGATRATIAKLGSLLNHQNLYFFNIWSLETYTLGTPDKIAPSLSHTAYTVESLAAEFIKNVKLIQPAGPYFLYGYSFGGLVVYEAAQQLKRMGDKIGLLILVDTYAPLPACRNLQSWLQNTNYWLADELRRLKHAPQAFLRHQRSRIKKLIYRTHAKTNGREDHQLFSTLERNTFAAAKTYRAYPIDVPVIYFKAAQRPLYEPLLYWNWDAFLNKSAKKITLDGDHHSLFDDQHIKSLALEIDTALAAQGIGSPILTPPHP